MSSLKQKVAELPDSPGVYFFKDASGGLLYIGKAKSLKKRVQSYFSRFLDAKTQVLVSKVADVEYRPTSSESQAQLLEAALIKEKQPPYNIDLKDDKSFPWIRISNEEFPRIWVTRRKKTEKPGEATYYGPYTNAALLRQAFKVMRRIFGFCTCKSERRNRLRPCLYYRLKLCPAPCAGKISAKEYGEMIDEIKLFLESKYEALLEKLSRRMKEASQAKNFESAARLRDQISALSILGNAPWGALALSELEDLKNLLGMEKLPRRIEAFDISNIQGVAACGSMVSFLNGVPDKNNYRRFRIKTVEGIDDYKMLAEVMGRRYSRLVREQKQLPDLILIDGGKQHLLVGVRQLERLGLKVPLVSIAKEEERIYVPEKEEPIKLSSDTPALNLIRKVRDEAHRFAITYHRLLRKKKALA